MYIYRFSVSISIGASLVKSFCSLYSDSKLIEIVSRLLIWYISKSFKFVEYRLSDWHTDTSCSRNDCATENEYVHIQHSLYAYFHIWLPQSTFQQNNWNIVWLNNFQKKLIWIKIFMKWFCIKYNFTQYTM